MKFNFRQDLNSISCQILLRSHYARIPDRFSLGCILVTMLSLFVLGASQTRAQIKETSSNYENIQLLPGTIQQTETSIAIDPSNPLRLLVGANALQPDWHMKQAWYSSIDGGIQWYGCDSMPLQIEHWDPTVAFDHRGNAYFSSVDWHLAMVKIYRSSDGGQTWPTYAYVPKTDPGVSADKPHLAMDTGVASPYRGRVYSVYTDKGQGNYCGFFSFSSSQGDSFSAPIPLLPSGTIAWEFGYNIATSQDGKVYLCAGIVDSSMHGPVSTRFNGIGFRKSSDGGQSFSDVRRITDSSFKGLGGINYKDYLKSSVDGVGIRAWSFPSMAVAPVQSPNDTAFLYVAWADQRYGDPDVFLCRSPDGGDTWDSPVRVNDDTTHTDQWSPWLTVDPSGKIHIVFYDSRNDQNNVLTTVCVATSTDKGKHFTNETVSDIAFTPWSIPIMPRTPYHSIGDYIGIASDPNFVFPCWNDNRSGVHQVYIAKIPTNREASVPQVSGHITANTTWDWMVDLVGDVTVDSGVTLTIKPRARITPKANADNQHGGADSNRTELIVKGSLVFESDTLPLPRRPVFKSSDGAVGSWYGIRILAGGHLDCGKGVRLFHGSNGLTIEAGALVDEVRGVLVEDCSSSGITLIDAATKLAQDTIINASSGIVISGSNPHVDTCLARNCSEGIFAGSSSATIRGCQVLGPGTTGIDVSPRALAPARMDLQRTPMAASGVPVPSTRIIDTKVTGYFANTHVLVDVGMYSEIDSCEFATNQTGSRSPVGVSAMRNSQVSMRRSKIIDFGATGYNSFKSASSLGPDNVIYSSAQCTSGCTVMSVRHTGRTTTDTLRAELNWWGTASPASSWFSPLVDYTPWLTQQPKRVPEIVQEPASAPTEFALGQNYPNPFNPSTTIDFSIRKSGHVKLQVFNVLGQEIRTLMDQDLSQGTYQVRWDGRDGSDQPVASGVYYYRLEIDNASMSKAMVLLK